MASLDQLLAEFKKLHPLLIDLSLGRVERLLERLGAPHRKLPPVIHIAGTNGKGSVTAYLKAMFEAAGRKAHVYTSPHLVRFNERIVVAGADGMSAPIFDEALVALLERVARVNDGEPVTFFEITTAAAFLAFAEAPADAVILEVGLGGRLDATNVIDKPALTVITPISMDHADKLGDTVQKIAREKAGIMKRGVTAVISQQLPEVADVLMSEAERLGAKLLMWGQDFDAYAQRGRFVVQREDRLLDLPMPGLVGAHQIVNAGTAVAAALELEALGLDEAAIEGGLVAARWPARMQRLERTGPLRGARAGCEIWLDGGHNPAAGEALARTLADLEERSPRPLALIVGMMGQKDAAGFLAPFRGLARRVVAVPIPGAHEKPMPPEELAQVARSVGLDADAADGVEAAVARIMAAMPDAPRILICGSLYLAGNVLAEQQGVATQSN